MWSSLTLVPKILKCKGATSFLLVTDVCASLFDKTTQSHTPLASPSKLANLLIDLLTPRHTAANQQRIAKYSPRYRLAFSLLNENAALGKSAIGWGLNDALSRESKLMS